MDDYDDEELLGTKPAAKDNCELLNCLLCYESTYTLNICKDAEMVLEKCLLCIESFSKTSSARIYNALAHYKYSAVVFLRSSLCITSKYTVLLELFKGWFEVLNTLKINFTASVLYMIDGLMQNSITFIHLQALIDCCRILELDVLYYQTWQSRIEHFFEINESNLNTKKTFTIWLHYITSMSFKCFKSTGNKEAESCAEQCFHYMLNALDVELKNRSSVLFVSFCLTRLREVTLSNSRFFSNKHQILLKLFNLLNDSLEIGIERNKKKIQQSVVLFVSSCVDTGLYNELCEQSSIQYESINSAGQVLQVLSCVTSKFSKVLMDCHSQSANSRLPSSVLRFLGSKGSLSIDVTAFSKAIPFLGDSIKGKVCSILQLQCCSLKLLRDLARKSVTLWIEERSKCATAISCVDEFDPFENLTIASEHCSDAFLVSAFQELVSWVDEQIRVIKRPQNEVDIQYCDLTVAFMIMRTCLLKIIDQNVNQKHDYTNRFIRLLMAYLSWLLDYQNEEYHSILIGNTENVSFSIKTQRILFAVVLCGLSSCNQLTDVNYYDCDLVNRLTVWIFPHIFLSYSLASSAVKFALSYKQNSLMFLYQSLAFLQDIAFSENAKTSEMLQYIELISQVAKETYCFVFQALGMHSAIQTKLLEEYHLKKSLLCSLEKIASGFIGNFYPFICALLETDEELPMSVQLVAIKALKYYMLLSDSYHVRGIYIFENLTATLTPSGDNMIMLYHTVSAWFSVWKDDSTSIHRIIAFTVMLCEQNHDPITELLFSKCLHGLDTILREYQREWLLCFSLLSISTLLGCEWVYQPLSKTLSNSLKIKVRGGNVKGMSSIISQFLFMLCPSTFDETVLKMDLSRQDYKEFADSAKEKFLDFLNGNCDSINNMAECVFADHSYARFYVGAVLLSLLFPHALTVDSPYDLYDSFLEYCVIIEVEECLVAESMIGNASACLFLTFFQYCSKNSKNSINTTRGKLSRNFELILSDHANKRDWDTAKFDM